MPTALVTGGAGFIGSCLVRQLIHRAHEHVVTLDKLTYAGHLESLSSVSGSPLHQFVQGDIGDQPEVLRLLETYRPEVIYHLAAESHVDRSIDAPAAFVETNIVGTCALLEATLGYWWGLPAQSRQRFRLLHISTDEVYGSVEGTGKFTESTAYAPRSPYAASKASADHLVRAYGHTYELPVLVTNCSNNYGPFQFPEKLIPLMILNALEGRPLPVYGDGQHVRDWVHVEDHCEALRVVATRGEPGETYHIGGDCELTNVQVVQEICQTLERVCPDLPHRPLTELIQFVTDRPGHDRRYAMDTSKIRNELGWQPRYTFASGLAETIQWYLENSAWVQKVNEDVPHRHRQGTRAQTADPHE